MHHVERGTSDAEATGVQRGTGPGLMNDERPQVVPSNARFPDLAAPPLRMTSTSEAEHVTEWGRELGVHLRALRRLAGLSQGRLASIVGTSQPSLSRLERGHVAKQVLLVIGVAQVITRALSRLDEMALREETPTLLR